MKKLLVLFFAAIVFAACEGPQGPAGQGTNIHIREYTIESTHWRLVQSPEPDVPSFWFYEFDKSELTRSIFENGRVRAYLYIDPGTPVVAQTPLPHIIYKAATTDWAESYSFDFRPGFIAFYVRYSDFNTVELPPRCIYRVVMEW